MATLQPLVGGQPPPDNNSKRSFAQVVASTSLSTGRSDNPNAADAPHSLQSMALEANLNHPKPTTGLHKGEPAAFFIEDAVDDYVKPFRWSLIGKFSKGFNKENPKLGRPSIELIGKFFVSLDLKEHPSIGLLDNRHVVIHLKNEQDFLRIYSRMSWQVEGHLMRIFKWQPSFHVNKEPSLAPIWISFPKLPLHFFNREALYTLASLIGNPLRMDSATATLSRPSSARVQVEVDLLKAIPEKIWIGIGSSDGFWQKIDTDYIPPYCLHCWHVGHSEDDCTIKNPELKQINPEGKQAERKRGSNMVYRPKPTTTTSAEAVPYPSETIHNPLREQAGVTSSSQELSVLLLKTQDKSASIQNFESPEILVQTNGGNPIAETHALEVEQGMTESRQTQAFDGTLNKIMDVQPVEKSVEQGNNTLDNRLIPTPMNSIPETLAAQVDDSVQDQTKDRVEDLGGNINSDETHPSVAQGPLPVLVIDLNVEKISEIGQEIRNSVTPAPAISQPTRFDILANISDDAETSPVSAEMDQLIVQGNLSPRKSNATGQSNQGMAISTRSKTRRLIPSVELEKSNIDDHV